MNANSLKLRLLTSAGVAIALALALTFLAIAFVFERHVERRVTAELSGFVNQIAGQVDVGSDGKLAGEVMVSDDRFARPLSGLYWQVELDDVVTARSQSLWDQELPDVDDTVERGLRSVRLESPELGGLHVATRTFTLDANGKVYEICVEVGLHRQEIAALIADFRGELGLSMMILGLALLAAAAVQVYIGLIPLADLRKSLAAILSGEAKRLDGSYPAEVMPLVEEFNGVLAAHDRSVEKARQRAGDLAHGLKTPLTVLSAVSRSLRQRDLGGVALEIDDEVEQMRRHVERELARARISTGRTRDSVLLRRAVERVVGTLRRLPKGDLLDWRIEIDPRTAVAIERADLDEVLGNILDNARTWAKSRVVISISGVNGHSTLCVEDDGPGVPAEKMVEIIERGARLDEARPGSGLGLAIVGDIADVYGVTLSTFAAPLGGLGVRFGLPGLRTVLDAPSATVPASPGTTGSPAAV